MASDRIRESAERTDALAKLHKLLAPGDTVYTVLRHVSRSGMQRVIDLQAIKHDQPVWLTGYASTAGLGRADRKRSGIVVGGCGMDMGFHLVYELSSMLWPDGFGCIGDGCHANDHTKGDRDYTPHGASPQTCPSGGRCWCHGEPNMNGKPCGGCGCTPATHWHRDGGYALQHKRL